MNLLPKLTAINQDGDPDPLLDGTLTHLANAEPAPDFNARLLRHLQAQTATHTTPGSSFRARWTTFGWSQPRGSLSASGKPHPRWRLLAMPTVAAALLLALLLPHEALLFHPPAKHIPAAPTPSQAHKAQSAAQQTPLTPAQITQPKGEVPTSSQPASKFPLSQRTAAHGPDRLHLQATQATQPTQATQLTQARRPTGGLTQAEAQALEDLHTPSHPAPPLPLTAQERALVHLLRHEPTVELAQLDPARQAKLFERQRADFQQFFDPPPPPPLPSEGDTK